MKPIPADDVVRLAKKAVFFFLRGVPFESSFLETEDIVQETLIAYLRTIDGPKPVLDPAALMFGIAENTVKRAMRLKARDRLLLSRAEAVQRERMPIEPRLFAIEEFDAIRRVLSNADQRVLDFIIDNPNATAEEVAHRLAISHRAYEGTFYRIRNASYPLRYAKAMTMIANDYNLSLDRVNSLSRLFRTPGERAEVLALYGLRCMRLNVLDFVQFNLVFLASDDQLMAGNTIWSALHSPYAKRDPALQLAGTEWRLQVAMSWSGGAGALFHLGDWIRQALPLLPYYQSLPDRFEDYLYLCFETQAGQSDDLALLIESTLSSLDLPPDHIFRSLWHKEQNRSARIAWPY